jgi:hypothetical protein
VKAPTHPTSRLNVGAVEDVLGGLWTQWEAGKGLVLDLRDIDAVERAAGGVLANALAGTLGSASLHLRVSDEQVSWLTAAGITFALANRPGPTVVDGKQADTFDWSDWLYDWRLSTAPTTDEMAVSPSSELFAPEIVGETALRPDLFGPGFAAFVNPHLSTPRSGPHPVSTVLWPWLDRLLRQVGLDALDRPAREEIIADIGGLVDETVINISDHAAPAGPDVLSLVQLSVTRGGGSRSSNRLHLCIQDTGPGIVATARPKAMGRAQGLDDAQLIEALLEGSLAPWGRGRGQGLPRVVDICRTRNATLRIFTKNSRAVFEGSQSESRPLSSYAPFSLDGTVVALTVPLGS